MPACSAKNCNNRSEQGFRLFRFPSDEKRKRIWGEKCGKDPKKYSRLCEYHFDDSQFENQRMDGWRKLKPNAVPTIFFKTENITKVDAKNDEFLIGILPNKNIIKDINNDHDYYQSSIVNSEINSRTEQETNLMMLETRYHSNENGTIRQANEIKYLRKELAHAREKINMLQSKLEKERPFRLKARTYMKAYKNLKIKHLALTQKFDRIPVLKRFASDMVSTGSKWSQECLKTAAQIKYAVGWKAYLYMKKNLDLPLPSYSTLCRHLEQLNFDADVSETVSSLIKNKSEVHDSSQQDNYVLPIDSIDIFETLESDVSTSNISHEYSNRISLPL